MKWNVLILIMYFCYQSENAYIFYVIVFDKQVTLYSRLFVFFLLMSDERPECIVNWLKNPSLIFYYQIVIYSRIHFV